jgi:hypothetical protein
MDAVVRRKLAMATRVRDFARAHPFGEPSYPQWLERLEERLARADVLATQQREGSIAARGATFRRGRLRTRIRTEMLPHLVRVGEVLAARERPELIGRFRQLTANEPDRTFITAARAMHAEASAAKEAFVRLGLAEALLGELGQALTEFESMVNAFNAGRREHIGARAELDAVVKDIGEVVRMLDGLNRYRFGSDPNLMAVWNAARDVFGFVRPKSAGEPPSDGATPPSGDIAPAA